MRAYALAPTTIIRGRHLCHLLHSIVVDPFRLAINAIGKDTEEDTGEIDLAPMREMTALGKVHSKNSVPALRTER